MNSLIAVLNWLLRAGVPAMLEGAHGIGKTSIGYQLYLKVLAERTGVEQATLSSLDGRELAAFSKVGPDEFGLWSCSAANLTVEELIGYPQPQADGRVHYLRSYSFIPPPDHRGGGIWMVDELNLAFPEVERALMSLALEGRYLDYVLPAGVFIITSQNPAVGEYHSRKLNPPTLNRFCILKVQADAQEVMAHFRKQDFRDAILDCLSEHHDKVLNPHQAKLDFSIDQQPTSRSWEFVNRLMTCAKGTEVERLGLVAFSGLLGPTAANVFHKYAMDKGERTIPVKEVLSDYGIDMETFVPDKTGMENFPMTKVRKKVRRVSQSATVRMDIINDALERIMIRLTEIKTEVKAKSGSKRGDPREHLTMEQKTHILNVYAFLCDIPSDQTAAFVQRVKDVFDDTMGCFAETKLALECLHHFSKKRDKALSEKEAT